VGSGGVGASRDVAEDASRATSQAAAEDTNPAAAGDANPAASRATTRDAAGDARGRRDQKAQKEELVRSAGVILVTGIEGQLRALIIQRFGLFELPKASAFPLGLSQCFLPGASVGKAGEWRVLRASCCSVCVPRPLRLSMISCT
jgi:hypothetical protein